MSARIIKDRYNEPSWNNIGQFTKPNGRFEANSDGQSTFVPRELPPAVRYDRELIALLVKAERKVGELKGKGSELENPHILIRAYLKKEAVLSSKIEGTLASLKDLNRQEVVGNVSRKDADNLRLREVINYVNALESSLKAMRETGQRTNMDILKAAHKILMDGVRGYDKEPGKFRDQQNWIIRTRGRRREIVYTPPPPEKILALLENLEEFIQTDDESLSVLIRCAVLHYQFEAIHPFIDGNGRIGRLLIPLVLYEKRIMPEPLLYLSAYFDKHRERYYSNLLAVSQKSRWPEWIKFFLMAFIEQADEAVENIQRLMTLMRKYKDTLRKRGSSGNVIFLMESLFSNPYVTIPKAARLLEVTYPSAKNAVMTLVDAGILQPTDILYKSKVFVAREIEDALSA